MDNILYVDDEKSNLNVFRASFKSFYTIFVTEDVDEAMKILKNNDIQVVISDQRMPGITGVEFLKKVKEKYPDVVSLILTAYTDVDVVIDGFTECSIFRYVTKPWDNNELKLTLDNAIETYHLRLSNKGLIEQLKTTNASLEERVNKRTKELVVANRVKSKLFNYISTELGAPIKNISEFIDLMVNFDNAVDFEKAKKYGNEIRTSFMQTSMLLEKLYRWASLELNNTSFQPQRCILNNYINSNVENLRINALRNKISLKSELGNKRVVIKADPSMLNFMISNVIQSAINVGEKDSVVTVGVHNQNGNGLIKLSGESKEMCEFISKVNNNPTYYEQQELEEQHYDTSLTFMIFNEYLKISDGGLQSQIGENNNSYSINFTYPKINE